MYRTPQGSVPQREDSSSQTDWTVQYSCLEQVPVWHWIVDLQRHSQQGSPALSPDSVVPKDSTNQRSSTSVGWSSPISHGPAFTHWTSSSPTITLCGNALQLPSSSWLGGLEPGPSMARPPWRWLPMDVVSTPRGHSPPRTEYAHWGVVLHCETTSQLLETIHSTSKSSCMPTAPPWTEPHHFPQGHPFFSGIAELLTRVQWRRRHHSCDHRSFVGMYGLPGWLQVQGRGRCTYAPDPSAMPPSEKTFPRHAMSKLFEGVPHGQQAQGSPVEGFTLPATLDRRWGCRAWTTSWPTSTTTPSRRTAWRSCQPPWLWGYALGSAWHLLPGLPWLHPWQGHRGRTASPHHSASNFVDHMQGHSDCDAHHSTRASSWWCLFWIRRGPPALCPCGTLPFTGLAIPALRPEPMWWCTGSGHLGTEDLWSQWRVPRQFGVHRIVLHAFSGRRRVGDFQFYLDALFQQSRGPHRVLGHCHGQRLRQHRWPWCSSLLVQQYHAGLDHPPAGRAPLWDMVEGASCSASRRISSGPASHSGCFWSLGLRSAAVEGARSDWHWQFALVLCGRSLSSTCQHWRFCGHWAPKGTGRCFSCLHMEATALLGTPSAPWRWVVDLEPRSTGRRVNEAHWPALLEHAGIGTHYRPAPAHQGQPKERFHR